MTRPTEKNAVGAQHTPLHVERETQLIVTDDAKATPILCLAAGQPLEIAYDIVRAYNAAPELLEALIMFRDIGHDFAEWAPKFHPAIAKARAAIARAVQS
jgi:hypothetical protein